MRKLLFILTSVIIVVATSCKKLPTYPDIPALEYKSVTFGEGDLGKTFTLTVSFTDGDGDIGYNESGNGAIYDDTSSQYYKNFVITMSYLDTATNTWRDTSLSFGTRLPYLTPDGPHKALKATIDKTDDLPFLKTKIRFTAFIYDRALHKSNTIVTPEFFVDNP